MLRLCGITASPYTEECAADWPVRALSAGAPVAAGGLELADARFAAIAIGEGEPAAEGLWSDGQIIVAASARFDTVSGDQIPPGPAATRIAWAWRRWGVDCVQHLHGDLAFVIHDPATGETFLACDHIRARPLFYALQGGKIAFASELSVLLGLPGLPLDLDEAQIATALARSGFEPRGASFHRAIRRVQPGHYVHVRQGKAEICRWWRPELLPRRHDITDADAVAEARRLVRRAVADRLHGADRFGVHLSGGLDCSLVARTACDELADRGLPAPVGYCWQEADADADPDSEAGWAETMRSALGLTLVAPQVSAEQVLDMFRRDWLAGPDVRNLLHEEAVQRDAAARGVGVILSGWGGDEGISFNGRGYHPHALVTGRWLQIWRDGAALGPREGLRALYGAARRLVVDSLPLPSVKKLIRRGKTLGNPDFLRRVPPLALPHYREFEVRRTMLSLLRDHSTSWRIEDWALNGMRHGVEYRYPLLDRQVLEFVTSLPPRMFRRGATKRWLMREVLRGMVPEAIRLNECKDEPKRVENMFRVLAAAYAEIGARLDRRQTPPERARFVDMPRMRERLSRASDPARAADRPLRVAVQMIDFD